jgi:hypothetical protein
MSRKLLTPNDIREKLYFDWTFIQFIHTDQW